MEIKNGFLWDILRNRKTRRPTKDDLKKFFLTGIITEEKLRQEMEGLGYLDKYIDWYIKLWRLMIETGEGGEE